jgi:hypothetical protein
LKRSREVGERSVPAAQPLDDEARVVAGRALRAREPHEADDHARGAAVLVLGDLQDLARREGERRLRREAHRLVGGRARVSDPRAARREHLQQAHRLEEAEAVRLGEEPLA